MKNEFKKKSTPKSKKKEKATKKKEAPKTSFFSKLSAINLNTNSSQWKTILGLSLMLTGLILTLSFVFHLFSWSTDQDKILNSGLTLLGESDIRLDNKLGRFGGYIAHQFFFNGFGLPSFIISTLILLLGINITFKKPFFPILKWSKTGLILLILLSITFGLIFQFSTLRFGGAFGNYIVYWLNNFAGSIGCYILVIFLWISYIVFAFDVDFGELFNKLTNKDTSNEEESVKSIEENEEELAKTIDKSYSETENIEPENKIIKPTEEVTNDIETQKEEEQTDSINFEVPEPKKKAKAKNEAPELEMEIVEAFEGFDEVDYSDKKTDIVVKAVEIDPTRVEVENLNDYDPTLDLSSYKSPTVDLLEVYKQDGIRIDKIELEKNKDQIINTLLNYKIEVSKIKATVGPTVTLYEIVPAPGVRISKIKNLEDDIALSLAALGIRIIAPIPGKGTIGIEVPNVKKEIVSMRSVLSSEKFKNAKMDLPLALGNNIANEVFIADLAKMPHMLIAGATGQGKSVGINAILVSLLYKKHPSQLKFVLVDPKKVELSIYSRIEKHFLAKLPGEEEAIITDTSKVVSTVNALCVEMDQRYDLLKNASVRNLREYNEKFIKRKLNPEKGHKFLPYIVLVIDEFADLIMTAGKEIEMPIARLAQLARAIGIHLIVATQRPSVNILTGVIKANFPVRLAFKVSSKIDSRTILDQGGADQLIGRGDMLLSIDGNTVRLQCAFIDTPEVDDVTTYISEQQGYSDAFLLPEFMDDNDIQVGESGDLSIADLDDNFEDAARVIVQNQVGSTSMIQRRLKLGYNRAGRIMDQLEAAGIVGPNLGSKARDVLIPDEYELEQFLNNLKGK